MVELTARLERLGHRSGRLAVQPQRRAAYLEMLQRRARPGAHGKAARRQAHMARLQADRGIQRGQWAALTEARTWGCLQLGRHPLPPLQTPS